MIPRLSIERLYLCGIVLSDNRLDCVTERTMPYVVQKGRKPESESMAVSKRRRRPILALLHWATPFSIASDCLKHSLSSLNGAADVFEAVVVRSGEDQIGEAELLYTPHTLD